MDTDLVSFRIDAELHRKAAAVCADRGLDLHDVLRALISQIARDASIPVTLDSRRPPPSTPGSLPVIDEPRLWADLRPQISAETALTLLMRVIARLSARLDELLEASERDGPSIDALTARRTEALVLRQGLDVTDQAATEQAISACTDWLRSLR